MDVVHVILINLCNYSGEFSPYSTALSVGAFDRSMSDLTSVVFAVGVALCFLVVFAPRSGA